MKFLKFLKEIKEVFRPPTTSWYVGKLHFGTPYFDPIGFCSTIINVRKLFKRTQEEQDKYSEGKPWLIGKDGTIYKNLPMVRRSKNKIISLFSNNYYVEWGSPIKFKTVELGWKDKWHSPRHEWNPAIMFFFFKWQICYMWVEPSQYWEQVLWWKYYCDKDIKKAEETWGWVDMEKKQSTWNKQYLK